MLHYATTAAELRSTLTDRGIKEPLWSGFQWSCKNGGSHLRQVQLDASTTFELAITAQGTGYQWSFSRTV